VGQEGSQLGLELQSEVAKDSIVVEPGLQVGITTACTEEEEEEVVEVGIADFRTERT
jgi:hypothetical protein